MSGDIQIAAPAPHYAQDYSKPFNPNHVEVEGSWGIMLVNRWTGHIVERNDYPLTEGETDRGYRDILRFNPATIKGHSDILDLGYWHRTADGGEGYEPPVDRSEPEDDRPRLNGTDDWLDLKDGDEAIAAGRLDMVGTPGIIITFANWSQLAIESDDSDRLAPLVGKDIRLVVTRTEDGLFATADAVTDALVEHGTI